MDYPIEDLKERVLRQIREMQEHHRREMEPLLKILMGIRACDPPPPIFIDLNMLSPEARAYWESQIKDSGLLQDETK